MKKKRLSLRQWPGGKESVRELAYTKNGVTEAGVTPLPHCLSQVPVPTDCLGVFHKCVLYCECILVERQSCLIGWFLSHIELCVFRSRHLVKRMSSLV